MEGVERDLGAQVSFVHVRRGEIPAEPLCSGWG